MQTHCELLKANVFDVMPLQFYIKIDPAKPYAMNTALSTFTRVFGLIEDTKHLVKSIFSAKEEEDEIYIDESVLNINLK